MKNINIKGAVLGAFCADAFSLGPHWEYNTKNIEDADLDWSIYNDPIAPYHKGKKAGDFTHYGDQMLWLLEFMDEKDSFIPAEFAEFWKKRMSVYSGYMDKASAETLKNMETAGDLSLCGSGSADFSAAGRFVAMVPWFAESPEELHDAAVGQAVITHNSPAVIEAAGYFADLIKNLLGGMDLTESLIKSADGCSEKLKSAVKAGIDSGSRKTSLAVKKFGQACSTDHGFSGTIHLLAKYSGDYRQAVTENARSGGDSSARGIIAGAVLGLVNGIDAIPENWIKGLSSYRSITDILDRVQGHS